jgi:hypothetical protein
MMKQLDEVMAHYTASSSLQTARSTDDLIKATEINTNVYLAEKSE